jgi:hypothetical protein
MNPALYRDPVLLDSATHRNKRLRAAVDYALTAGMHACFLGVSEFPTAASEFPIVFLDTGEKDEAGRALMSPIAVLGVESGENLMVEDGRWAARYVPAFIRRFPFFSARVGEGNQGVFIESSWSGFSDTEGERLFDDQGQPTDVLKNAIEFLQRFDEEAERTRRFCVRLMELDLLEPMTANLTLPNGQQITLDGFFTVKEPKLAELEDAVVLEMHKSGMLMLVHAHLMSLGMMRNLADLKGKRLAAAPAANSAVASAEPAANT